MAPEGLARATRAVVLRQDVGAPLGIPPVVQQNPILLGGSSTQIPAVCVINNALYPLVQLLTFI